MTLEEALRIHREYELTLAELVGGPGDGSFAIFLQDVDSYNGHVYQRSFRVSPQHYEFYCYDYVGHWSDPVVMQRLDDAWGGWKHIKDQS